MEAQRFYFKVKPDDDSGDIQFLMGVDNHSFETYITGWSNCWDSISEKLEEYLHTGETTIELDFDTEPTCLSLKKKGDCVFLDIKPSGFTKERPFSGLCSEKDVLCKLYYGLLYAMTFRYDDIGCGWNWDDCKMVCYNRMKSRTIEEFLLLGTFQRVSPFVVKHVLVYDGKKLLHIAVIDPLILNAVMIKLNYILNVRIYLIHMTYGIDHFGHLNSAGTRTYKTRYNIIFDLINIKSSKSL